MKTNYTNTSYLNPYARRNEPRVKRLYDRMWFTGMGIFDFICEKIRLGHGSYALKAILEEAHSAHHKKQLLRVLNQFNLFLIDENEMVSLASGLNATAFRKRETVQQKAQKAEELRNKAYEDRLFPDQERQLDLQEADRLQKEIKSIRDAIIRKNSL